MRVSSCIPPFNQTIKQGNHQKTKLCTMYFEHALRGTSPPKAHSPTARPATMCRSRPVAPAAPPPPHCCAPLQPKAPKCLERSPATSKCLASQLCCRMAAAAAGAGGRGCGRCRQAGWQPGHVHPQPAARSGPSPASLCRAASPAFPSTCTHFPAGRHSASSSQ